MDELHMHHPYIFLIYVGIVLDFTLDPNACRDRNLCMDKAYNHRYNFVIYVGIVISMYSHMRKREYFIYT